MQILTSSLDSSVNHIPAAEGLASQPMTTTVSCGMFV